MLVKDVSSCQMCHILIIYHSLPAYTVSAICSIKNRRVPCSKALFFTFPVLTWHHATVVIATVQYDRADDRGELSGDLSLKLPHIVVPCYNDVCTGVRERESVCGCTTMDRPLLCLLLLCPQKCRIIFVLIWSGSLRLSPRTRQRGDVKVCLDGVWCWRQTQKNNKGLSVLVVLGWKSGSRKSPAERQSNCLINNVRKSSLCGFFGHEVGVSGRRQPQLKHHERWNSEMIVREIMSLVNVFYFVGPALSSSLLTFRCQFIRMEP